MAERTVNVRINYQINTGDIQKATAASNAAQRATDNLRKAVDDYAKASSQANKTVQDSLKRTAADTSSVSREFGNLYSSVKLFLTAGLAKEILDISLNMAKLSGQVEGVQKAFNRLPNSTLLLDQLRTATRGTVTDLQLMQKALTAQNFRIPLENLGTLLEFAAVKAQQTGQEVNHLVDYIVSGIGYRSIKRLDDLGFTANRVKEALGGVTLQAASMGQVMEAITKLMNEDLQKTGGYAETAATGVARLETAWHELGVEFSKQTTSTGFTSFLTDAVDALRLFVKAGFDVKNLPIVLSIEAVEKSAIKQARAFQESNKHLSEQQKLINTDARLSQLSKSLNILDSLNESDKNRIPILKAEIEQLQERNKSLIGLQKLGSEEAKIISQKQKELETIDNNNTARLRNKAILAETIEILVEYRDSINSSSKKEEEAVGIIARKKAEIEALQDQIEATNRIGDLGASGKLVAALAKAQEELDALLGKSKKKQKEVITELQEYIGYLSDLEMHQVNTVLEERVRARKEATQEEIRLEKEAAKEKERIATEEARKREQLQRDVFALTEELIHSTLDLALNSREEDLDGIRESYDKQIELAGDNERAKDLLRKRQERELTAATARQKRADQKAAQTKILIDGLIAIGKIFAEYGWPAGIAPAAIMAGITATNVANVRKYAKGKINIDGPGTSTSDSIPAMLSRGESVMTAEETRRSMGILEAIKSNRIDDKILRKIDFSGGKTVHASLSDDRIVKELVAIKSGQNNQLETQGRLLYRVYKDGEGNKVRRRSKLL